MRQSHTSDMLLGVGYWLSFVVFTSSSCNSVQVIYDSGNRRTLICENKEAIKDQRRHLKKIWIFKKIQEAKASHEVE